MGCEESRRLAGESGGLQVSDRVISILAIWDCGTPNPRIEIFRQAQDRLWGAHVRRTIYKQSETWRASRVA